MCFYRVGRYTKVSGKGKKDVVHYHNTPVSFAALLFKAKEYADNHPDQPKLITINAWNEWVEGSYLLPDMLNGFGYLKAVKKFLGIKTKVWHCSHRMKCRENCSIWQR